jgi:hypothetical protein
MRRLIAFAVLIALMAAGCIQPVQKLGCCIKANATDPTNPGCVLYNLTSFTTTDAFFSATHSCDNVTGCNVTIGGVDKLIPICTADQIVPCINGNCTALVCGDYNYKPRVAPGFTSIDDAQGNAPPDLGNEGAALQFYKAQCRFLPLDAQLRQVMKNSKSQIDVFRMGAGGSFDEFDQYRYYFPISDKYCNINPPLKTGDLRVDRYMNYLQGDFSGYDPVVNSVSDCVQDPGNVPPFLGFGETTSSTTAVGIPYLGVFTYSTKVPDQSNYKFATYGRIDLVDTYQNHNGGFYTYDSPTMPADGTYKTIDTGFYRKYLSIAHADTIYGLTSANTTRAPFECDASSSDCYSGSCNINVYNRGVMLAANGNGTREVVTDCNKITDENGESRVVCAPTTNVVLGSAGNAPNRNYADVNIVPMHIETSASDPYLGLHYPYSFTSIMSDPSIFDLAWQTFNTTSYDVWKIGADEVTNKMIDYLHFYDTKKAYCSRDYGSNNDTNTSVICTSLSVTSDQGPPAGGAVFFGKLKDDKMVTYRNQPIIGYAIANPSDFPKMEIVKNCGINETPVLPSRPNTTDGQSSCYTSCIYTCWTAGTTNISQRCTDYCDPSQSNPTPACTPGAPISNTTIYETNDYVRIDLSGLSDGDWRELITAFQPYFDDRANAVGNKGVSDCNGNIDPSDLALSSMPWVLYYEKGLNDPSISLFSLTFDPNHDYGLSQQKKIGDHMSSNAAQALRTRNIFDESMASTPGTSACELGVDSLWWFSGWGNTARFYYNVAFTRYLYLFKYNSQSKQFGSCLMDDNTKLPEMKTYGWCEPCTTSTLAYQKVTANSRVYMPFARMKLGSVISDYSSICTSQYNTDWVGFFQFQTTDNVSCYNPRISDVNEYKESIGGIGSPRTSPEATVIKERIGDYLKSGIMPVFDISDSSNWNLDNPDSGSDGFCLFYFGNCNDAKQFQQYDFERLFGHMGAVVAIVDHVSNASDAEAKLAEITNRSTIVRDRCFGCLTAVHVDSPSSNASFGETIEPILTDFTIKGYKLLDLVTFDYPVSSHPSVSSQGAEAVAEDIIDYGRTSLQMAQVPTMVVGLNVEDNDGTWSDSNFKDLFDTIVQRQGDLVKAGVLGVIYSPVRGDAGSSNPGLVDVSGGVGSKSAKFCAFQGAMYKMSTVPPNALFTRVADSNETACEPCNSLDKVQGICGPPSGQTAPVCDNGNPCTLPAGANATDYKCPDNTIVGECTLCSDMTGKTAVCTYRYANGTETTTATPMSDITSDVYLDVLGGIPKPNKCCVLAAGGNGTSAEYTYSKQSFATPQNKPLVFPKTGDPNVDCGFGSSVDVLNQLSNFCNVQTVPLKNYDINCTVVG